MSKVAFIAALMSLGCYAKHIVLIAGDQEYRSEESIPALAKILETRHGFQCTVLYSINRKTGAIDPATTDNIPGLEALRKADLMILFTRYLELPDDQMKEIVDYTNSGRPVVGLRTATHAFHYTKRLDSPYAKYGAKNKDGGYGRQVLGETWIAHYGAHQKESTRGVIVEGMRDHPILRGCARRLGRIGRLRNHSAFGRQPAAGNGAGTAGHGARFRARSGEEADADRLDQNVYGRDGEDRSDFHHHDGACDGLQERGFRRLLVNACYWAMGLEKQISREATWIWWANTNRVRSGCVSAGFLSAPDNRDQRRKIRAGVCAGNSSGSSEDPRAEPGAWRFAGDVRECSSGRLGGADRECGRG